ncbi:RHS repeat-associated core domain-containing protein, partial [Pseudomonas agarici]|uniref:RHS repeat-associated core domain-containing protein n=1 Tax=Pseudomonas agarici TaxID=46677 RepID=UPI0021097681
RFTWDGLRLLQEHKNTQTSLYLYVDEGYEPLARVDGLGDVQKIRYYHTDPNGLPEQLTEADGTRVWQARYKVWGNTLEEVREPYYIEEQNLRFQGQYLDRETGLHYNTFRFYDPDVGRFTTPDPIGLMGGVNLYQYAPNPAGYADPLGLSCGSPKSFARKNTITKRWVGKLSGRKPADVDSYLTARGWIKTYPQAARPDAIQHVQFFRATKSGTTYKLDYHPGSSSAQSNIHGNDYWKIYRTNKFGEDIVLGRIGYGNFKKYDLIKDSPVYVSGNLMNGGIKK